MCSGIKCFVLFSHSLTPYADCIKYAHSDGKFSWIDLQTKTSRIYNINLFDHGIYGTASIFRWNCRAGKVIRANRRFLFAAIAISVAKGKRNSFIRYVLVTIGIGIPIQHLSAIFLMCLHNGFNVWTAVITVSVPFILGDIIKCIIAAMIGVALNKVLHV